tara:strand:+ start:2543 stop:3184 length:642 start_codon:yes stop_codon:yes gene_type:complete
MKSEESKRFTEYYRKKNVTGTYDRQREGTEYRRRKRALELKYFLDLVDKKVGERVLELGCSSGFLAKYLGKVTCIDTSDKMLEITKKKNPSAVCVAADMFELPFKKDSFDKIITMRVWNHLDETDLRKALKESKRVLKPGGFLIFDIEVSNLGRRIVGFFYQKIFRTTGFKIYQYSVSEIKKILKDEGYSIKEGKTLKHKIGKQIILKNQLDK